MVIRRSLQLYEAVPSTVIHTDALACTPPAVLAVLTELVLMVLAAFSVLSELVLFSFSQ
jgi:hypothetical protein